MNCLRWTLPLLLCSVSLGCGGSPAGADAGMDAGGRVDAAVSDSGTDGVDSGDTEDAGLQIDAGVSDAGVSDAAVSDAGVSDAAVSDAGVVDAGMCPAPPLGPSRPVVPECAMCRPPGIASGGGRGECTSDADCTAGDNGRCGFSRIGTECTYDQCFKDADCGAGELCACDAGRARENICIVAGCTTDADCGAFTCSPTYGGCGPFFPYVGYFCHGATDECRSDADCSETGPRAYCARDATDGIWRCSTVVCVG